MPHAAFDHEEPDLREQGNGRAGRVLEVFRAFLKLGLTAFGGPIAHLGYYRTEFVESRRWLDDKAYADLLALCQFLPGPASSQTGFALGLMRAGPLGALAAWIGFTLPSAVIMAAFAFGAGALTGPVAEGIIEGLKIAAVAIVAQAVLGMARSLAPDGARAGLALFAVILVVMVGGAVGQVAAIAAGALLGLFLFKEEKPGWSPLRLAASVPDWVGIVFLVIFFVLLAGLPLLAAATGAQGIALADAFYRAGALVFGGGHVVLPLLQESVVEPGWVTREAFLAGYGAAQALPGPIFTFAAYLGAVAGPEPNGLAGAALALLFIFLPGMLLLLGILPFWDRLRAQPWAQASMRGTNAAVVGILGAALYDPVFTSAITGGPEFALALTGFVLLVAWRLPSWLAVLVSALGGIAINAL